MPKKQAHEKLPPGKPFTKGHSPTRSDGQPVKVPSLSENEALIEMVSELLAMRKHRWEIRNAIQVALGREIPHALLDKLVAAGQRFQIDRYKRDRNIHLGEAQTFYEHAIREAPDWRDKLAAQGGLNAIHGLEYNQQDKEQGKMNAEDRQEMYRQLLQGLKDSTENTEESVVKPEDE